MSLWTDRFSCSSHGWGCGAEAPIEPRRHLGLADLLREVSVTAASPDGGLSVPPVLGLDHDTFSFTSFQFIFILFCSCRASAVATAQQAQQLLLLGETGIVEAVFYPSGYEAVRIRRDQLFFLKFYYKKHSPLHLPLSARTAIAAFHCSLSTG